MSLPWEGIGEEAVAGGISAPLAGQIELLGSLLGRALEGQAGSGVTGRIAEVRRQAVGAYPDDDALRDRAAAAIGGLELGEIVWLLRAFTTFFHLVNQAEKQEIVRINRERARAAGKGGGRSDSIEQAVGRVFGKGAGGAGGLDEGGLLKILGRLDVQPTLTAHPTEARRRTVLRHQRRIAELLATLRSGDPTPSERERAHEQLAARIALLLTTDEVPAERPTVRDEVEQGLYFLTGAIWETVPRIHWDLERALRRRLGDRAEAPVFLRYRSWIGSDRDGNPNVTPEVTRWTALAHRRAALGLFLGELGALGEELSLSDRQASFPATLLDAVAPGGEGEPAPAGQLLHEPFRRAIRRIEGRLEALLAAIDADLSLPGPQTPIAAQPADAESGRGNAARRVAEQGGDTDSSCRPERSRGIWAGAPYTSADLCADLDRLAGALAAAGLGEIARAGRLGRLRVLAASFGFALAGLDVRQHSRVHEAAVAEILRLAGVCEDYSALPEADRLALLGATIESGRPLATADAPLSPETADVLAAFAVVREAIAREPGSIRCYIVSMTHTPSDLLEVLLLARHAGLGRADGEEGDAGAFPLDLVPLFETVEDLAHAGERLGDLFADPVYRRHLASRGDFQEVMLGYSDSNKDGGYWMANWALHQAQGRLARTCEEHGIDFRLFHGRGGTVGRGGGRANQAILAMPAPVHNGRIRFTEQGEVISFRYGGEEIARRHLEQVVAAMIEATAGAAGTERGASDSDRALVAAIAERSAAAYRELIHGDGFWAWYAAVTPIEQISRLPIASRPVSRGSSGAVDFAGLRAIPWGFAWTQTRYLLPGWYGIGTALEEAVASDAEALATLRRLYRQWPFVKAVVDNAQLEMARARLAIAGRYARLGAETGGEAEFHQRIASDFAAARRSILAITGGAEILDNNPVIQRSIAFRNPYTDVLNLLQIELLRRYRAAPTEDARAPLRQALYLAIDGIAAAMQSTG